MLFIYCFITSIFKLRNLIVQIHNFSQHEYFNYPVLGWFYQEQNFSTLSFSLLQVYWPWHLIYCFTWLLYSYYLGKKIWFREKLYDLRIITMLRANQIARIKSDIKMDIMEVSKSEKKFLKGDTSIIYQYFVWAKSFATFILEHWQRLRFLMSMPATYSSCVPILSIYYWSVLDDTIHVSSILGWLSAVII